MPNGLERNPYCDAIMYFQAMEVEKGKKSILLRLGEDSKPLNEVPLPSSECVD